MCQIFGKKSLFHQLWIQPVIYIYTSTNSLQKQELFWLNFLKNAVIPRSFSEGPLTETPLTRILFVGTSKNSKKGLLVNCIRRCSHATPDASMQVD